MTSSPNTLEDGIDVAIAAFLAARLTGESTEVASRNAKAMLDLFGIPHSDPALPAPPEPGK